MTSSCFYLCFGSPYLNLYRHMSMGQAKAIVIYLQNTKFHIPLKWNKEKNTNTCSSLTPSVSPATVVSVSQKPQQPPNMAIFDLAFGLSLMYLCTVIWPFSGLLWLWTVIWICFSICASLKSACFYIHLQPVLLHHHYISQFLLLKIQFCTVRICTY